MKKLKKAKSVINIQITKEGHGFWSYKIKWDGKYKRIKNYAFPLCRVAQGDEQFRKVFRKACIYWMLDEWMHYRVFLSSSKGMTFMEYIDKYLITDHDLKEYYFNNKTVSWYER